jgi:hypothetical protein
VRECSILGTSRIHDQNEVKNSSLLHAISSPMYQFSYFKRRLKLKSIQNCVMLKQGNVRNMIQDSYIKNNLSAFTCQSGFVLSEIVEIIRFIKCFLKSVVTKKFDESA